MSFLFISIFLFPADECAPDTTWKFFQDKCYFFSGSSENPDDPPASTWYDAEHWCKSNGGFLTSIHDDTTNAFITGQVKH